MKKQPRPFQVIIDTREQNPLDLKKWVPDFCVIRQALPHGDYSLAWPDLSMRVCIERKSLEDFVMCVGRERGRFETELLAMRGYEYRLLVIESKIEDMLAGKYRSLVHPHSVMSFLAKCLKMGISVIPASNHDGAGYIVAKFLEFIAKQELGLLLATASVFPTLDLGITALACIDPELLGYPQEGQKQATLAKSDNLRTKCPQNG